MNSFFKMNFGKARLLLITLLVLGSSIAFDFNNSNGSQLAFGAVEDGTGWTSPLNQTPVDNNSDPLPEAIDTFLRSFCLTDEEYDYYSNKQVVFDYSDYKKISLTTPFLERESKTFQNVNGRDVEAKLYYVRENQNLNHPNIGLGLLLYRAVLHKLAHPEIENEISATSFHFSIYAGLNVIPESPYYGTMKWMPDEVLDRDGFIRFSYLLVFAAKIGIKVNVIPQLFGYSNMGYDADPKTYFEQTLALPCSAKHGLGSKTVGDYMVFHNCDWVSYGSKSATDMYHLKCGTVRYYLDDVGNENEFGIFLSSANLDGVDGDGVAGNRASQTGVIITNHEYLYRCLRNFVAFSGDYMKMQDVVKFRAKYKRIIEAQKKQIAASGYEGLENDLMIYLGSDSDPYFEFYITPFSDDAGAWTIRNPFCKYVDRLFDSRQAISFVWHNPKFTDNFSFLDILTQKVSRAFKKDRGEKENKNNYLVAPTLTPFSELKNDDQGQIKCQEGYLHEKDMFLQYEENGVRKSVSILNSLNIHQGAFWNQVNSVLVIKEEGYRSGTIADWFIDHFPEKE